MDEKKINQKWSGQITIDRYFNSCKLAQPEYDCSKNSPTKIQVEINFLNILLYFFIPTSVTKRIHRKTKWLPNQLTKLTKKN